MMHSSFHLRALLLGVWFGLATTASQAQHDAQNLPWGIDGPSLSHAQTLRQAVSPPSVPAAQGLDDLQVVEAKELPAASAPTVTPPPVIPASAPLDATPPGGGARLAAEAVKQQPPLPKIQVRTPVPAEVQQPQPASAPVMEAPASTASTPAAPPSVAPAASEPSGLMDSIKNITPTTAATAAAVVTVAVVGVGMVMAGVTTVGSVAIAATGTAAATAGAVGGTAGSFLQVVLSMIQKFIAKIIANPLQWLIKEIAKRKLIKYFKLEHILTPAGLWRNLRARWAARKAQKAEAAPSPVEPPAP
ncbi:MAG: hypothetical protein AB3X41_10055 [Leptothrix ochracea]|uniref:hypothetical protein n=1 Tax=Leptothrix ochracea TaxID=735331 RepID=UPI0034E2B025